MKTGKIESRKNSVKRLTWTVAVIAFAAFFMPADINGLETQNPKKLQKIITPNGDGNNDKFFFFYNDDEDLGVSGSIYNILGMKIADFKNEGGGVKDPNGTEWEGYLYWEPSSDISPGIYIWVVESGGTVRTGTVVVAK